MFYKTIGTGRGRGGEVEKKIQKKKSGRVYYYSMIIRARAQWANARIISRDSRRVLSGCNESMRLRPPLTTAVVFVVVVVVERNREKKKKKQ